MRKMRGSASRITCAVLTAAMLTAGLPVSAFAYGNPNAYEAAEEAEDVLEDALEDADDLESAGTAAEPAEDGLDPAGDTLLYTYTRNASLMDPEGGSLPGIYSVQAVPGDKKDTATIGIPSIAKQNLETAPTTESPAIIQGAAVPFEKRADHAGIINFDRISDKPICAPYSYFRYELMDEAGKGESVSPESTHKKITGFDGTYVIMRIDVSELIKNAPAGSYLHVKQSDNKVMLVRYGEFKTTKHGVESVSFSHNNGTSAACYPLDGGGKSMMDEDGDFQETPYVDVILMSSGTIVAGADKGTANAVSADFPVSFYVDQTADYRTDIMWDEATKSIVYTETRQPVTIPADPSGTTTVTPDDWMIEKYYDETKSGNAQVTSYNVKGEDLELEVEVDETSEDVATPAEFWSLRRATAYQAYNSHTIKMLCEVPLLEGLKIEDNEGTRDREVVFDVNSFDIQVANHAETNAAGITVDNATLTILDSSNTTGAELAVGNNSTMLITNNGKLIIDKTCQLEVEYDASSQAVPAEGEPQPAPGPELNNGVMIIEDGGILQNEGVITVEGMEGKAQDPSEVIIRDYKDARLTIGKGGTLINNGCVLVNGSFYNQGTIINNGKYEDTITSTDPDKGTFTYHMGIQLSWKDDVTQGKTNGGMLINGMDGEEVLSPEARIENSGDIVLIPGYFINYASVNNTESGTIYLCAVDEVVIPKTATQDQPTVVEERVKLGYFEDSYMGNMDEATLTNAGIISTADFEITSNGRTGDMKKPVSSDLSNLSLWNYGNVNNSGTVALNSIHNAGTMVNSGKLSETFGTEPRVDTLVFLRGEDDYAGSLEDSAPVKTEKVYNGSKTVDGNKNIWRWAGLKSLTVTPASAIVATGSTQDWTVSAEPEKVGDGIKYLVDVFEKNPGMEIETIELTANGEGKYTATLASTEAPASSGYLVFDFTALGVTEISDQARIEVKGTGIELPTPIQDLVYNGKPQRLVTVGRALEGEMQYKVNDGEFSPEVPDSANAGDYTVSYQVVKDGSVISGSEGQVQVSIKKSPLRLAAYDLGSQKGEPIKELQYAAYGLAESDKDKVHIHTDADGSTVGTYPITITFDNPDGNYDIGENTIRGGTYTVTEAFINHTASSNMAGYQNMNCSIGMTSKHENDKGNKDVLSTVYYSDTEPLTASNYKEKGTTVNPTYAVVGTDKTVHYFVVAPDANAPSITISGNQQVMITKGQQEAPKNLKAEPYYGKYEGGMITGLSARKMEYRRSDSDEYITAVHERVRVSAGTYYVRMKGDDHYFPSADTVIEVTDGDKTYLVSFDTGSHSTAEIPSQNADFGDVAVKPSADPTRTDGKAFVGWLLDGRLYDFDTPVTRNLKLIADWDVEKHTVSFDSRGGSYVPSQIVEEGDKATAPATPVKKGSSFNGWKTEGGSAYDFDSPVNADTKLVADWTANKYTVAFDSNGGEGNMEPQAFNYGESKALTKNAFTRNDYGLYAWNTSADGKGVSYRDGQEVSNLTDKENGTVTLFAQWRKLLTSPDITVLVAGELEYNGKHQRPNVMVKDGDKDITQYCYFSYSENKSGICTVTVSVHSTSGGYMGSVTKEFEIEKLTASFTVGTVDRVYEKGNVNVEFSLGEIEGLLPGDKVTVDTSKASCVMEDDSAGEGKKVTLTGLSLAGEDGDNYIPDYPKELTVNISPSKEPDKPDEPDQPEDEKTWNLFKDPKPHVYTLSGINSSKETSNSNKKSVKYFNATLSGNQITVSLKDNADRKKAAANNTLDFDLGSEGAVSFMLPVAYNKPVLKLSSTKGTVKAGKDTALRTTVLEMTENGNYRTFDTKDAKAAFGSCKVTLSENGLAVINTNAKASGKLVITKEGWNDKDPVAVKYGVTASQKDIISVDMGGLKQVVLNTTIPEQEFSFPITLNGEEASRDTVTIAEDKKKANLLGSVENGLLTVSLGTSGLGKGSYTLNLKSANGNGKLSVKVKVSDKPVAVTGKVKQKYDLVTGTPMLVTPQLKEASGKIISANVLSPAEGYTAEVEEGNINISIDETRAKAIADARGFKIGNMDLEIFVEDISSPVKFTLKNVSAKKTKPVAKVSKAVIPKAATVSENKVLAEVNVLSTWKDASKHQHVIVPLEGEQGMTIAPKNVTAVFGPDDNTEILIYGFTNGKNSGSAKATLTYPGKAGKTVNIKVSRGK